MEKLTLQQLHAYNVLSDLQQALTQLTKIDTVVVPPPKNMVSFLDSTYPVYTANCLNWVSSVENSLDWSEQTAAGALNLHNRLSKKLLYK